MHQRDRDFRGNADVLGDALLERVEERAIPVVAPDGQPHLRQRQQEEHQRCSAHLRAPLAVPVRAGEAQDLAQEAPSTALRGPVGGEGFARVAILGHGWGRIALAASGH
jgi:hypothetical protein